MFNRVKFNFLLAVNAVAENQLRALLTGLGIVFGVAAVIAMLGIGTGAKQSILDQMKLIGTNNIVIKSKLPEAEANQSQGSTVQNNKKPYSNGLTLEDARSIQTHVPGVELISPEIIMNLSAVREGRLQKTTCTGVTNAFFDINQLELSQGKFFQSQQLISGEAVCIIGNNVAAKFFSDGEPLGQKIKCGQVWLTVIGVLNKRLASAKSLEALGIRDYNDDIYVPVQTAITRFENRSMAIIRKLKEDADKYERWMYSDEEEEEEEKPTNYHQLDRLVIRVADSKQLQSAKEVIARMLFRRHDELTDFDVEVPELLLQQQQKTQNTFNLVLGAIAGISLLVGGIGIMNIMLASVLERVKEIGVRRSLGATRLDIILQFLFEAIFISLSGGVLGIALGLIMANIIGNWASIPTIVPTWSIFLSFGVASSIGLIFGIFPARKAAMLDPITALRTD